MRPSIINCSQSFILSCKGAEPDLFKAALAVKIWMSNNHSEELVLRASTSGRQPLWGREAGKTTLSQCSTYCKFGLKGLVVLSKGTGCDDFSDFPPEQL